MSDPVRYHPKKYPTAKDIPLSEPVLYAIKESFGIIVLLARCKKGVCTLITGVPGITGEGAELLEELAAAFPHHKLREDVGRSSATWTW